MNPHTIIPKFKDLKIAVIGDVMLDRYVFGHVERISPEAPIPIVQWHETMLVPGGAGNTAANITSLGAQCDLYAAIGTDHTAEELKGTLDTFRIATDKLVPLNRLTTEKMRVLGNHQQIVRIDHESSLVSLRLRQRHRQRNAYGLRACDCPEARHSSVS
jgi:D-glycero-beta-D-manno-heptose-7-phosphate kinase